MAIEGEATQEDGASTDTPKDESSASQVSSTEQLAGEEPLPEASTEQNPGARPRKEAPRAPEPGDNKKSEYPGSIIAACITAGATLIAALIGGAFLMYSRDDNSPPPSTTTTPLSTTITGSSSTTVGVTSPSTPPAVVPPLSPASTVSVPPPEPAGVSPAWGPSGQESASKSPSIQEPSAAADPSYKVSTLDDARGLLISAGHARVGAKFVYVLVGPRKDAQSQFWAAGAPVAPDGSWSVTVLTPPALSLPFTVDAYFQDFDFEHIPNFADPSSAAAAAPFPPVDSFAGAVLCGQVIGPACYTGLGPPIRYTSDGQ